MPLTARHRDKPLDELKSQVIRFEFQFHDADLDGLPPRGPKREPVLVGRISDSVQTAVEVHDGKAEVRRSRDAVIGPDDRRWECDFVVFNGDQMPIAVEVKELTGSTNDVRNDHAELARGLGQCLVYRNRIAWGDDDTNWRFAGALLLVVMPENGVGLAGTSFACPLMIEDDIIDGRFWIYGLTRRLPAAY